MNNHLFDLMMLAIMVPMAFVLFFYYYPKKWKDRKFIFGVRNREEFKNLDVAPRVDDITGRAYKQTLIILVASLVIMGLLCLIPDFVVRMTIWTLFVMVDLIFLMIPFVRGNGEMKSLKRETGLIARGVSYTDFTNVDAIHALKLLNVVIPNIVGGIAILAAFLYDAGIITFGGKVPDGSYEITWMLGAFMIVGLMMIPIALLIDRMRNEVISEDSDINKNFNRAKKKNWADTNTAMVWVNTIFMVVCLPAMILFNNMDTVYLVMMVIYMALLIICIGLYAKRSLAIDRRYRKETSIEVDDDDFWILGTFYYNPDDKRLNVEKRSGLGATVNMAHPVGKAIGVIGIAAVFFTIGVLIWTGKMGKTPISMYVDNGNLVCHHTKDDYVIPVASIEDPVLGENSENLNIHRTSGYEMPPVVKGKCSVDGEKGCIVFINFDAGEYIRFTYDGRTYYVSGGTAEETEAAFQQIEK